MASTICIARKLTKPDYYLKMILAHYSCPKKEIFTKHLTKYLLMWACLRNPYEALLLESISLLDKKLHSTGLDQTSFVKTIIFAGY